MNNPNQMLNQARGSFSKKALTKQKGRLTNKRPIDYVPYYDQLEYLFYHSNKGLRIIHPDGSEETPHHDKTWGSRFLFVTNKRLIYVAGLNFQDKSRFFKYTELTDVGAKRGLFDRWIKFTDENDIHYKFADNGTHSRDIQPAADYIQKKVENNSHSSEKSQKSKKEHKNTQKNNPKASKKPQMSKEIPKPEILSQLRQMDPYEFEEFVAKIWEKQGWDAEVTSGSADRGIDVIAIKEDVLEKRRHLIQVKRHGENKTVGSEDIQRYASLYQRDEQVDNVFVVTSNRFTSEAKEVAKRRDVSTINGDKLYEMFTET